MTRALLTSLCVLASLLAANAAAAATDAPAAVDDSDAAVVTELVTTALGHHAQLEVVSSSDLRRQVALEADRQAGGCDSESSSCLAEVADAMGAQLVVQGTLGDLDDVIVLTLTLFDSSRGQAIGRVALKDRSLAGLSSQIDGGVAGLLAEFQPPPSAPASTVAARARVLVLDITVPKRAAAAPAGPSLPFIGGVTGVGVGVVALVVGGGALFFAQQSDQRADALDVGADAAALEYDNRDGLAVTGAVAVGIAVVAGAVGVTLFFVE